ncbi:hypothetical protein [Litoreibacter roseus]|uniref:Uncharacterized protein n=1 Tax=Litoreibacter roseus TaxID=2601869 RepID=A0A6N6JNV7_9RHOB|nr:hypothetical protein [Litoreibacter roseus]GFE67319.1 hypothetical protein KIN_43930 [Litoreibacter roseus]
MSERSRFLLSTFVVYVALVAVGFVIAFPDGLSAQNATPAGQGASVAAQAQDAAWKAVERIDSKIANAIVFLTVFAALLPIVVALYEASKLRELQKIKDDQKDIIRKEINETLTGMQKDLEEQHLQQVSQMIHSSVSNASDRLYRFLDEDDAQSGRILAAYLNNDVGGDDALISNSELASVFHLQRTLRNLAGADQDNVHASLVHLKELLPRLAFSTAIEIYRFLWLVERQGKIITLSNRETWAGLSKSIRETHQIPDSFEPE